MRQIDKQKATMTARRLLFTMTKTDLAEELEITRMTLNERLKNDSWKKGEAHLLKSL